MEKREWKPKPVICPFCGVVVADPPDDNTTLACVCGVSYRTEDADDLYSAELDALEMGEEYKVVREYDFVSAEEGTPLEECMEVTLFFTKRKEG